MLGRPEEGVSGYIDKLKNSLDEYQKRYDDLYQEIETTLRSGATTVSLTKNFSDKVKEYKISRRIWERGLFCLFMVAVVGLYFSGIHIPPYGKELVPYIFKTFSLAGILIWVAIFMGNRRAESRKLEESYKHKEVMARSFVGYKESIKELDDAEKSLLTKHMDNLLDAIKKDSSNFLSAKGEGHPLTGGDNRKTGETQSEPR